MGMNVIDEPQVVITEKKRVPVEAEDGARTAVHDRLSASRSEEAGDEIAGLPICGSEAHNFVAGSDVWVACAMKGDQERVREI